MYADSEEYLVESIGGVWEPMENGTAVTRRCFRATWKEEDGRAVYNRAVYQQVSWCSADGRTISSLRVTDWPTNGSFCPVVWGPATTQDAGGLGRSSVTYITRAQFRCDLYTLPDPTFTIVVDVRYNANGSVVNV